jgi:DNA repair exonuclease SbcCD ATPase subunit
VDLDEVADELYAVPPEEFVTLRKTRQDEAKADGDKALAKEIGALPKPSAAAWACNLLVREQRAEIEGLVDLGDLLREAQENLAGDQLRALDVQRRQLLTALTRQARALTNGQGHPVSTAVATQIEETLRAAMSDPEAGQALLTGRLTSPMTYSGMGTTVAKPDLRLVHPPRPERTEKPAEKPAKAPRKQTGESAAERRAREQEERRRAAEEKRQRELARAREAAEAAVAAAEEAAAAADEQRREVEGLEGRRTELQERVEELAEQLADAERAAADAAATLKRAQRRLTAAQHEADEAAEARDRAVAHVDALAEGD